MDHGKRNPICSSLITHSLNLDEDIFIDVVHPDSDKDSHCKRGVSTFTRREFDRLDDTGDDEDFRWIPDLEGPEFHNRKLKIKNRSKLKPTIFLSDGILYTRQKTNEVFARVLINGKPSPKPLGRLAYGLNADITCPDGGEVILSNRFDRRSPEGSDRCVVRLPQNDRTKYLITVENHCQLPDELEGTDFRLYYDVVSDPEGKQFDLRRIVNTGCHAAPEEAIEERSDFTLDGFPQKCLVGIMGITESFGG
jgi:hypothetical protein